MRKKLVGTLLIAAMTASTLAGCGSSNSTAGTSASGGAAETSPAESATEAEGTDAADGEEVLTVWCWDPTFNVYAMKQAEAIYQKDHPNFKLDIQEKVYTDIEQNIITAAEADNYDTLPDIFLMQDNSFQKYVTFYPDVFTDLTDSGIDFSQFSAAKVAYSSLDEKNYGVPFDNGAVVNCLRTDLIEQAGYTTDDFTDITWSDYMEKAKVVLEKTGLPMLTAQAGSPDVIMMMLQSCGASLFNEDGTGNIAENDVLKKCVEIYAQMVADGTLVEVTDWDQYISSLNSSTVASTFNGCWIMASIQAAEDQSGKWAVTNMPKLDDVENASNYSNNGGSSWAISSNTSHKDLAVDFLNATFAGSTELYDDIISKGALATWAPAGESDAYNVPVDFYGGDAVYAKIVDFATKTPSNTTGAFYYDARDAVGVALSNITQTGADVTSELQTAQETLDFNMGM